MKQPIKFFICFLLILPVLSATFVTAYAEDDVLYYTCGMHPSVRVTPEAYKKGETKCPICHMPLTPVKKQPAQEVLSEKEHQAHVISRVNIKANELKRAGIQTVPVVRRHLFKEIRAVGTVAYDPKLAVAQDEYLSAVRTLEQVQQGKEMEILQRAASLVQSAERKLRLLGLSEEQIDELKIKKEVQTNLILPDKTMWIYGDVYEYELPWITKGAPVKVVAVGLPTETFYGYISSINPVLDIQTRTLRFRALIENPGLKLKPQMYVNVWINSHYMDAKGEHEVLAIPQNALLDTGSRKVVWVETSPGQFEGRMVEVGPPASAAGTTGQYYPVVSGLKEGESVVTRGNFLIDSQSQITGSAASSFGGALSPVENKGSIKGSHSM